MVFDLRKVKPLIYDLEVFCGTITVKVRRDVFEAILPNLMRRLGQELPSDQSEPFGYLVAEDACEFIVSVNGDDWVDCFLDVGAMKPNEQVKALRELGLVMQCYLNDNEALFPTPTAGTGPTQLLLLNYGYVSEIQLSQKLVDWIARQPNGTKIKEVEDVMVTIMCTFGLTGTLAGLEIIKQAQGKGVDYCQAEDSSEKCCRDHCRAFFHSHGGLTIHCYTGDAIGVGMAAGQNTLSSHNIDTDEEALTILAGLAALLELARADGVM